MGGSAQATATDDTADPALPQPLLAATPPSTAASDGTVEPIGPGAKPPSDGPAEAVTASPIATTDDISAQALGAVQPALTGATPPTRVAGDDGPAKAADDEDAADTKAPDGDAKPSDAAPAGAPVVIAPPAPVSLPIDAGVPAAIGPKAGAAAGAGSAARPASPTAAPSPGPGRIETETSAGAETAPGVSGTSANPGRRGQAAAGGAETSRPETAFQHVFQEVAGVAAPDLQAAIPAPATSLLAHVASTAGPAAASQPAPVTVHGVAIAEVPVEIGLKSLAGVNHFEIRLTPEGLGRIDVRLDIADDGRVNANLLVDQPDTLRFLQRDANHLERALEQAGLKSDGGIAMTLRDPGSQGQQQGQSGQGAGGRQERGSPTSARDQAEPAERPRWQQLSWTRASGIDRSI